MVCVAPEAEALEVLLPVADAFAEVVVAVAVVVAAAAVPVDVWVVAVAALKEE